MSANNSQEKQATDKLVENILETRFENFEAGLVENTKSRIIDTLGCLIGGANAPGNLEIVDLVKDWGGKEEATILIHNGRVLAQNAAMVNSIMARSFDYEPNGAVVNGVLIPSHISGTTIMTALTIGEMARVSGKELVTALLVGEDLACRLLAVASSPKRVDSIGTVNVFGTTAISGRLLGLSQSQMKNALGISLDNISGSYQNVWDRTFSFKLSQGLSARNGVFSAQLARKGWTATADPFLGKFAYFYLYFDELKNIEMLTKDLGKKYYTEAHFKPYASCRYNHGPIECMLSLGRKYQIQAEDVKEVTVYVHPKSLNATVSRPFSIGELPYANALFSYQYTVASALIRKNVNPEHFLEVAIRDPEINNFIDKVKLVGLAGKDLLSVRVRVIMQDGREFVESVDAPRGDQDKNPMSKAEIITKFWDNVDFSKTVRPKKAEKLLKLLDRLEEVNDVNRIVKLLVNE
jgi:2-methylcitrate dehydratase PrpD